MSVAVVDVGIVWVAVQERRMDVKVRVWFLPVVAVLMRVLVVRIMRMKVAVRERFVTVRMCVLFAEVQRYAGSHKHSSEPEQRAYRLV